jgi:hypothetical protein
MLKYFGTFFLIFSLISIPSLMIYISGNNYTSEIVPIQKYLALTTLGNMGLNSNNILQTITSQWIS